MKPFTAFLLATILLIFTGCGREEAQHEVGESESAAQQLFEKGKGIRLPEDMAKTFGVTTAEVTARAFIQRVQVAATVYQSGSSNRLAQATAMLNTDEAAALTVGQSVDVQLPGVDAKAAPGRLIKLESRAAVFGQVEALIEFGDAGGPQAAGTTLLATFAGPERKADHVVPAAAVIQGSDTRFVYSVNGEHFVRTPVKIGARGEDWVEVTDGLYAGDVIVARGGEEMWMIELCALKGGTPCCPVGKKPGAGRSDD